MNLDSALPYAVMDFWPLMNTAMMAISMIWMAALPIAKLKQAFAVLKRQVAMLCGDAVLTEGEQCDDGNLIFGDGCDDQCVIERGFVCNGACEALPSCANADDENCYDRKSIGADLMSCAHLTPSELSFCGFIQFLFGSELSIQCVYT